MIALSLNTTRTFGFSMVELLCSVALSLLLVTGVIATVMSSGASLRNSEQTSRVEERGWRALSTLARDIRAAGFNGCARSPRFESSSLNIPSLDAGIQGYDASDIARSRHDHFLLDVIPDSDVLVVHVPKRGVQPLRLRTNMSGPADQLEVIEAPRGVVEGDIALISDCTARSYFLVNGLHGSKISYKTDTARVVSGNEHASLGYTFPSGAEIVPIQTIAYYIRAEAPGSRRALWRHVGLNEPEKVIEGVETMELEFGIDENEDGLVDRFDTADAVSDWHAVQSVNVALLLRSIEESDARENSHQPLERDVGASNQGRARTFSSTFTIRNHAP